MPVWSLAEASSDGLNALIARVHNGSGLAAFHGAAASFLTHPGYRRLIGGTFVWHPEELEYQVEPTDGVSFHLFSEQRYMHVDPANEVTTTATLPTAL